MASILERAAEKVGQKMGQKSPNFIFDPTMIFTIMEIIFQLIERCRERRGTSKVVESIRSPGRYQVVWARWSVRWHLGRRAYRDYGRDLADSIVESGQEAEEQEVRELVNEVA